MDDKKTIRKNMRERRSGFSRIDICSEDICRQVRSSGEYSRSGRVLIYWPLPGEVDLRYLLSDVGKTFVMPVVSGEKLILRGYDPSRMESGYRGIMEPSEDAAEYGPGEIDMALVPGVAFAALPGGRYSRLGRGGGYYDRLLKDLCCPVFGVAFPFQILDSVPVESWDMPLDGVFVSDVK